MNVELYNTKEHAKFRDAIYNMPMGKDRRKILKWYFDLVPEYQLPVDRQWCRQVKDDSDLKYLIKKGFLKKIRQHWGTSNKSYLVKS